MINLDFPKILELFGQYRDANRSNSAAFLIWYLENYYRMDSLEAIDHVCDQRDDKGIDGIYVDELQGTIDVFQTKLTEKAGRTIGDTALKEFVGTLAQFKSQQTLSLLLSSTTNTQLQGLILRLKLINIVDQYKIRGIFISNMELDQNGTDYLKHHDNIIFIGKDELIRKYISPERTNDKNRKATFSVGSSEYLKYSADSSTFTIIAPIKALELVKIPGIEDQKVFSYNVRGNLGRTNVNKDIVKSIKQQDIHSKFPLFHNGITIVCNSIAADSHLIEITDFFVVNGCQSLNSLYEYKSFLTTDLQILVKFVQVDVESELARTITHYSNNQNGVKARDFKSNNLIQIRLKNEFEVKFGNEYYFEVKRGENNSNLSIITNENAGILLMAFDLKEPWGTHRKYQVFDDKYTDIFGRPEVDASRILMLVIIEQIIDENISSITNKLVAKYALTKYALIYILRNILEKDQIGVKLINNPSDFVDDITNRAKFKRVINTLIKDIIIDFNGEVDSLGEDFDYKSKLRDESWVEEKSKEIVSSYLKLVERKRIESFGDEWVK